MHRIGRVGRAGREGVAITFVEPREHHGLRNIERLTKHKIDIAKVPTAADLRARKLELTMVALREALVADDNEHYRVAVDSLSGDYDPVQIAMAAVKLYHQATVGESENEPDVVDIPTPPPRNPWNSDKPASKSKHPYRAHEKSDGTAPPRRGKGPNLDMTRIFIGAGRESGVRPQDLVGAIANEAGVAGSLIGAIQITDRFSLVEVPADTADQVIKALGKSTLRGKKVPVRRDKAD